MNTMRSFAGGVTAKLLMLLLIVSFGIWGVGDMTLGSGPTYAAKVGSDRIGIIEFQKQRAMVAHRFEAMGIKNVDVSAIDASVLRQLIQQKLILLGLHDLGFYVNETLLGRTLRAEPAFQNPDGTFSAKRFRALLDAQHISETEVLAQLKGEASAKFLTASMDVSDVVPPAAVRSLAATTALETRDAWIVTIAPLAAPEKLEETALTEFYERNKSILYMEPENRVLEYVTFKPAQIDVLIDRAITDEMLQDAAKQQPNASKQELRDRLRNEQRERTLHDLQGTIDDSLAAGMKLDEALKKAGVDSTTHTLKAETTLAKTSKDDVVKTVAEQGFVLGEGETSGLMFSPQGVPVIVHVAAVQPAAAQAYEVVAADVRTRVNEQLRRDATRVRMQEVKDALGKMVADNNDPKDKQWQSVLQRFNLTAKRMNDLSRPVEEKPGMAANQDGISASLRRAIFEHGVGTIAGPLTLENGGQMIAIVTGIHHPDTAALAANDKQAKELAEQLNQTVQMRAFAAFGQRHPVVVNPQLLTPAAAAPAEETP